MRILVLLQTATFSQEWIFSFQECIDSLKQVSILISHVTLGNEETDLFLLLLLRFFLLASLDSDFYNKEKES